MTKKEFNALRAGIYRVATQNEEIAASLKLVNRVRVYEAEEHPGNARRWYVCEYESQMNDETIRKSGLDPERTTVRLVLELDRPTKTVIL